MRLSIQGERDLSSAYIFGNGTDRGIKNLMIEARQNSDIAMKKLDPWPRTSKSPSNVKTIGNLEFFLKNLRAEVNNTNLFSYD